jgi:serine protease Do
VTVKSALKGGAGEKMGFKAGDILISIDGEKLSDLKGTTSRMADVPIGKDIPFVVRRAGQEKTIVVKGE